jgi:hypothetical protein
MSKLKIVVFLMLLAIVCTTIGCGPALTSGEVISKSFVPEHEEEEGDMQIGDVWIPGGTYTVPDKWYVTFGKKDESDKWRSRTIEISEDSYNNYENGDWIELE